MLSTMAPPKTPAVGVILGAAVWADGPSPTLRRRTCHGASLFHAGYIDQIVACGGLGKHPPTEAKSMAEILAEDGVSRRISVWKINQQTPVKIFPRHSRLLATDRSLS